MRMAAPNLSLWEAAVPMSAPLSLEDVQQLLDPSRAADVIASARAEEASARESGAPAGHAEFLARAAILAQLASSRTLTDALATAIAGSDDVAQAAVIAIAAINHPRIAALPLAAALDAQALLLQAFAGVKRVAFWRDDPAGRMVSAATVGRSLPSETAHALADSVRRTGEARSAGELNGVPVEAFGSPAAALVWAGGRENALALGVRVGAALVAPLQQALTADVNIDAHQAVVQGPERRLTRLALDLHDGALQDVALIAGELRRLEDELRPIVRGTAASDTVLTALGTLASLVDALDADLRDVATNVEGPSLLKRPFADVVEAIVRVFRARAPIKVDLDVRGELDLVTDSQRIALFRIVQEALNNVRQHCQARNVRVEVVADVEGIRGLIADDGVGFDSPTVLDVASRAGHLGLLGMIERVRLLGGRCDIDSIPGSGTEIRISLARYEPVPDRRAAVRAA